VPSCSGSGSPSWPYAPEYLNHAASPEKRRAEAKYSLNWLFSVFPNHRFDAEEAVAEGETVAARGTMVGTHEGELSGIPPTGERVAAQQSHWFRVAEGKVAEHWVVRGDLGTMKQLGVMPS
jgi:predicted ester cyclase